MGTWPALAIPCSPCLARKGQSWEHGRGARYGLSPLPVKQKVISKLLGDACNRLFTLPLQGPQDNAAQTKKNTFP